MLLYIHIPFCRRICSYCDFYHTTCLNKYGSFVEKLISDITESPKDILETIYFGGGTPSVLQPDNLTDIMNAIQSQFSTGNLSEITFECNPDDITEQYCNVLKNAGINRLSIGIQSFNDRHLKIMNRRHDSKGAIDAVKIAKKVGFRNITIDLIYGLPFMSEDEWQYNLDTAISLDVQHISAYHLTIEKGTIFGKKNLQPVNESTSEMHYRMLRKTLGENGFRQYEISNFAKEGFRAIHNSGYWTGKKYLGLGPSAHSFDGESTRWWQTSDIDKWLNGEEPQYESLTKEERNEEIIMTSLRTVEGLETNSKDLIDRATPFINQGYMEYKEGHLRILPEYFLVSDYIISQLI